MSFEKYTRITDTLETSFENVTLRSGDGCKIAFTNNEEVEEKAFRLFFTGETTLHYFWKGEYDCVAEYANIEDHLNNKDAYVAPYCLDLSTDKVLSYPKIAYRKVTFPPMLSYLKLKEPYSDTWKAGIWAKASNYKALKEDAYARITYEIRYKRDDLPAYATVNEADEIKVLDIPLGTYDWQDVSFDLALPKDKTANVVIYVETYGCKGKLLLERPYLVSSNEYNVLPDFQPPYLDHDKSSWIGVNLSRKEWPEFEITLNGELVYKGEMFERCHRNSECECDIPEGLMKKGSNELMIKLVSSYPNPLPYTLHEIGYFTRENKSVSVVGCPEIAPANGRAAILINTKEADTTVKFECSSGLLSAKEQTFTDKGLNVFEVETKAPANGVRFSLIAGNDRTDCIIQRVVERQEDNVLTGTGDLVYVNQERMSDFAEYISWYVSNNIGNLLTVRPTYRWSGGRTMNADSWLMIKRLCDKLGMKYVHMTDGREHPGGNSNPPLKLLDGENFLGRQSHEFDGAYIYWGHNEYSEFGRNIADYWMRLNRLCPDTVNTRSAPFSFYLNKKNGKLYNYLDPNDLPDDMEKAADLLVYNESMMRMSHTRHTGPSVAFKYFFQAGYKWTGAELMYGPLELITAFMRGAAYCYDCKTTGAHLAVQWSTTPHDTPDRYRRYRASLFSSYIQGITDINTEEGLWHLEEYYNYFNRESKACIEHKHQQQDLYRYISSHTRSGEFYTPFAFVFGRYDGFRSFGKDTVFARADWNSEAPEYSWELLNIFYPLETANGEIYLHPCPTDREVGMLTGTPRGNVDVLPIEADAEKMSKYKVLSFLGYNKALSEDCDKLIQYVTDGGTLVIGWPHLSVTTKRNDVISYKHKYIDHQITKIFSEDTDSFVKDTVNGGPVTVNTAISLEDAEIVAKTDAGIPLEVVYKLGKGKIYFVNAVEYPAEKGVNGIYRSIITKLSDELNASENAYISCDETVQFTKFKNPDGTENIYVLAVDWYHEPDEKRTAKFILNGKNYPIELAFGEPVKITVKGNIGVWSSNVETEILSINGNSVTAEGISKSDIYIVNNGELSVVSADFNENAVIEIKL